MHNRAFSAASQFNDALGADDTCREGRVRVMLVMNGGRRACQVEYQLSVDAHGLPHIPRLEMKMWALSGLSEVGDVPGHQAVDTNDFKIFSQ